MRNAQTRTPIASANAIGISVRILNLVLVVVPFLAFLAVIVLFWGHAFYWVDVALLLGMYSLTVLGITVGYHRLFTHRSFDTNRVVQFSLAVLGAMAVEGPLLKWVAVHRRHHQHSDARDDPHSPHNGDTGFVGMMHGLWHAHIGWFFEPAPANLPRYVKDLYQSRSLRVASALFPLWVVLGLLIPAILGGLLTGTWNGFATGLLWGGLARIFLVHHVTWSINSMCHMWGRQAFQTGDQSRNNVVFGILGFGEGWHNNHHAFPTSARFGLRWWQVDLGYWFICVLAMLGLATSVKQHR